MLVRPALGRPHVSAAIRGDAIGVGAVGQQELEDALQEVGVESEPEISTIPGIPPLSDTDSIASSSNNSLSTDPECTTFISEIIKVRRSRKTVSHVHRRLHHELFESVEEEGAHFIKEPIASPRWTDCEDKPKLPEIIITPATEALLD